MFSRFRLHLCRFTVSLALTPLALAALPDSPLEITASQGHLPGRSDYLSPQGAATLRAPAPANTPVTWFRDGTQVGSTPGLTYTLSQPGVGDTGNYHAVWREGEAEATSALLPVTVGTLPSSHGDGQAIAVGTTANGAGETLVIDRILPDHRLVVSHYTWAGVGQNRSTRLYTADLQSSTELHAFAYGLPWVIGVMDDGSFYLSEPPHRFRARGEGLPFTLPAAFGEQYPTQAIAAGAERVVLMRDTVLVYAGLDGTVVHAHTATSLGFDVFTGAADAGEGRILVHGIVDQTAGNRMGRSLRLDATGNVDGSFTPLVYDTAGSPPQRLLDGTWSRLARDRQQRFTADGTKLTDRAIPELAHAGRLTLAADGAIYNAVNGLGILRWRASDLALDGEFFAPQMLLSPTGLGQVEARTDGTVVTLARTADGAEGTPGQLVLLRARLDHAGSVPIIGTVASILTSDPYDGTPRYRPLGSESHLFPSAGASVQIACPFFAVGPFTAQWVALDGTAPPESTADGTLRFASYSAIHAGRYQLVVTNAAGRALGPVLDFRPRAQPRMVNLSGRALVAPGKDPAIAGFVLGRRAGIATANPGATSVLIRGMGPALTDFGITHPLADPVLDLQRLNGPVLAHNDDWVTSDTVTFGLLERLGAFPPIKTTRDASLYQGLEAGAYTARTTAKSTDSGIALTEIYLDDVAGIGDLALHNLSLRGVAGRDENALVAGFVIDDPDRLGRRMRVLVRAVGPALSGYGVEGVLNDPVLRVHGAGQTLIAENDNWSEEASHPARAEHFAATGAFLLPDGSTDAALVLELVPGIYTATCTPAQGTEPGTALIELYLLD